MGHSPDEVSDRFSLKYCSSPEGARLPQRSSSRESNSNASGHSMPFPMTACCKSSASCHPCSQYWTGFDIPNVPNVTDSVFMEHLQPANGA